MAPMQYTPESEIQNRIQAVQLEIAKTSLDSLLVVHHTNLFYYSGTSQNAYLFIPEKGDPLLMVRKSHDRAVKESKIKHIVQLDSLMAMPSLIRDHLGSDFCQMGLELDIIPYNTFEFFKNKIFANTQLVDASQLFRQMRVIKSEYEIGLLKYSCQVLDESFSKVPEYLREGMPEIELAALFEAHMRKNGYGGGCKVRAFNRDFLFGNIVSGSNGREPSYFDGPVNGQGVTPANNPHGAGWKRIVPNESIYVDYTCVINGYTADAERIFVMGKIEDDLMHAHAVALTIQEEVIKAMKPGVRCSKIWEMSVQIADQEGLLNHYMGIGKDRVKFIGHGVGLELDEMPIFAHGFDTVLEKGMTFALEPKFVFNHGAVGIENTFAVTETGVEKLNRFPEDIYYI